MICKTLFGGDLGLLDGHEEYPIIATQIERFLRTMWFLKHVPLVATLALNMPLPLAEILAPGYASFMKVGLQAMKLIRSICPNSALAM